MNSQTRLSEGLHRKTQNDTLKTWMHHVTAKTTCSLLSDSITLVWRKKNRIWSSFIWNSLFPISGIVPEKWGPT